MCMHGITNTTVIPDSTSSQSQNYQFSLDCCPHPLKVEIVKKKNNSLNLPHPLKVEIVENQSFQDNCTLSKCQFSHISPYNTIKSSQSGREL